MQPLNPFLSSFFRSPLPATCTPISQHIILVPTTEVLLTSRDAESGALYTELVNSEEFLASHVLRIVSSREGPNLRDIRGKIKQYSTHNGRTVVIKDAQVRTGKGFRTVVQAQLLNDVIWHSDTIDPKPWLVYYISFPLIGSAEEIKIVPAIYEEVVARRRKTAENLDGRSDGRFDGRSDGSSSGGPGNDGPNMLSARKDIKNFHQLITSYPGIARQMQPGIEKLFRDFKAAIERPLPPPPSAAEIPDPEPDGPIISAAKKARSNSATSRFPHNHTLLVDARSTEEEFESSMPQDGEDVMRASLETAVMSAIDIFQEVDKQQLSALGATTDLTGAVVERLLERYILENVHGLLFPRLVALRRQEDSELQAKIRQMEQIDVSQLGIPIVGGNKGKRGLTLGLVDAVDEFRKITLCLSPHDMLDILVTTLKNVAHLTEASAPVSTAQLAVDSSTNHASVSDPVMKRPTLTANADNLVSLLMWVVIRSRVRSLHARLSYIRNFMFVADIEHGETGYALSTFEAVVTYLANDSAGLRRASRQNRALWEAVSRGDVSDLRRIMEPDASALADGVEDHDLFDDNDTSSLRLLPAPSLAVESSPPSVAKSSSLSLSDRCSNGSNLSHIFFFENHDCGSDGDSSSPPPVTRPKKRVSMAERSISSCSEASWHSEAQSIASVKSLFEGDTSIERLAQTQDPFGESVLMMAIQHGHNVAALKHLLSLDQFYPIETVLEDCNHEDTTLLSAAVQLGKKPAIDLLLDLLMSSATQKQIVEYLARQDVWGRSVGHYLFHAPYLIEKIGHLLPWRQRAKNGQTPLFALCRSYDHADYSSMVSSGLAAAHAAQADGQPLHLDHHVDTRGNTLLHIVNDTQLTHYMLSVCDVDVNAVNDKGFTPLMVASKYGRLGMVRALYANPRTDLLARELRGLTAVELAKDDEVRNRIDDLTLFLMPPIGVDKRITGVVRSFFIEDATVRLVVKSGVPENAHSFSVTTSKRNLADFERLAALLATENPMSWIPALGTLRPPSQIPSRPSRAVLREIRTKLDWFLKILLSHPTFGTHEALWEFFLAPEIQFDTMEQRSRLKLRAREERVRDELMPIEDVKEVVQFVGHAQDSVRSVGYANRSTGRRVNCMVVASADLQEAAALLQRKIATLPFLPKSHLAALDMWVRALSPTQSNPHCELHSTLLATQSTITALLSSLNRPQSIITRLSRARRDLAPLLPHLRSSSSSSRSSSPSSPGLPSRSHTAHSPRRHNHTHNHTHHTNSSNGGHSASNVAAAGWQSLTHLLLLDSAAAEQEKRENARRKKDEVEMLGRELRDAQQTVALELAGWQEQHEKVTRRAIYKFAKGVVWLEKGRLEGLQRALRVLREGASEAYGS